jgi:glycosyltransferase involved in cell wall biosynthesis
VFPDVAVEQFDAFADNPLLLQEILLGARGRPILVLLGALDNRKGLEEFFRLADLLPMGSWFLVCAGRVYDNCLTNETSALLARARAGGYQNLLVCDRWLTEAEFDALLYAATGVFAAYRGFRGSSNLLTKAAQAAKPVLVAEGGLMALRVRRYQTGLVVPEGDVPAMADILTDGKLQTLASTHEFSVGCKRYRTDHSLERLYEMVGSLLNACDITER